MVFVAQLRRRASGTVRCAVRVRRYSAPCAVHFIRRTGAPLRVCMSAYRRAPSRTVRRAPCVMRRRDACAYAMPCAVPCAVRRRALAAMQTFDMRRCSGSAGACRLDAGMMLTCCRDV
jgi:hypothetical protein